MRIQPLTAALIVITGCAADAPNIDGDDPTTKNEAARAVGKPGSDGCAADHDEVGMITNVTLGCEVADPESGFDRIRFSRHLAFDLATRSW